MNAIWFPRVRTDDNLGSSMYSVRPSRRDNCEHQPDGTIKNMVEQQGTSIFLAVDPSPSSTTTNNPALRPAKGVNPQATLLGLPPELRLEIYDRLYPSRLTHVSTTGGSRGLGTICTGVLGRPRSYNFTFASTDNAPLRLFWRPCLCPSLSLDTCARPLWSGLTMPEESCSTDHCPIRYDFNIAATCKSLRREVLHHVLAQVSMSLQTAYAIFQSHTSDILDHMRHLTLTPDELYSLDSSFTRDEFDPSLLSTYRLLTSQPLPSLQSITMQTRLATKVFRTTPRSIQIFGGREWPRRFVAHPNWLFIWRKLTFGDDKLPRSFPVPIHAEFWAILTPKDHDLGLANDAHDREMLCIRKHIPRLENIKSAIKNTEVDDLEVSVHEIVNKEKTARWKSFWQHHIGDEDLFRW